MKSVLVLDANQRSALSVTRSLGKRGIPVTTAEETPRALASCSRFAEGHIEYPSPRLHPDRFIDTLSRQVEKNHIDILLPMTELTTGLLLENQAAFAVSTLPFPEKRAVDALSDKCSLIRTAESLRIPVPRSLYVNDPTELAGKLDELPYPLVLKPAKSWLTLDGEWKRAAVRFAGDPAEARHLIQSDPALRNHPFMIQEHIKGHGQGIFALYDNGRPVAFFAHRRLREKPPSGGVSVLSESIELDEELLSHARSLLDDVCWHGIAMVEFKIAPDGTPFLMEINTRFWGSLQLAVNAGVDFPYLLYQLACGAHLDPVNGYKIGTRLRWLLGDLDSLYLTLRDPRFSTPAKLGTMLKFLTPSPFRTRHEINRVTDLRPFWYELTQYLDDIFR